MNMTLKHCTRIWAVAAGISLTGGTIQAVAAPFFQDQGPDYSKNKKYQQGMHDAQSDRAHHRDHGKKKHFKKDEDQRAYEAGYQKGRGN
jgi:hypothetical protein